MKKITVSVFAFSLFLCAASCRTKAFVPSERSLSEELVVTEISDAAFLVTHSYPWAGNSLIVKLNEKDFVWTDTPYTPEATAQVLDWLYEKYGRTISVTEINTGFHIDNLGGNAELVKRNIPVYGSTLTCELLRTGTAATMGKMLTWLKAPEHRKYYEAYRDFSFVEPSVKFDIEKEQVLSFGKERVEIYFPGPTHTYDNLVVYVPGKKILFGGCMILAADAKKTGYVDDGNIEEWSKSMRKVEARFNDAEIVVPGHGKAGGKELLKHTIEIVDRERTK